MMPKFLKKLLKDKRSIILLGILLTGVYLLWQPTESAHNVGIILCVIGGTYFMTFLT